MAATSRSASMRRQQWDGGRDFGDRPREGYPGKELDKIFEKFYRRGKADGRRPGAGLGLAIAKGFVEAMGGAIKAESPAQRRRGTRIVLRFPVDSPHRLRRGIRMNAGRILVVDDEPQIQRFLKPALSAAGYEVIEATTGAEALKATATSVPDIVILDLGLPDMDGKEVIARIRAWSEIPVIILSARDRESEKIAALDLGADDYIEKPFGIGELTARIRTALRHRIKTGRRRNRCQRRWLGDRYGSPIGLARRRCAETDAEGVRPAHPACPPRGPCCHAQDLVDGGMGAGTWRRPALSARLHRSAAQQDRARCNEPANSSHGTRCRLSLCHRLRPDHPRGPRGSSPC